MDCKIEAVPIFITGAAGFIGYHLALRLLSKGYAVHGMDNLNAYYEVALKKERLKRLSYYPAFSFTEGDISDKDAVEGVFTKLSPKIVVNLAAQAGVRYSIDHPRDYIDSNIVGFFTILEACRHHSVNHLVYASSSSVYGNQEKPPLASQTRSTIRSVFMQLLKNPMNLWLIPTVIFMGFLRQDCVFYGLWSFRPA